MKEQFKNFDFDTWVNYGSIISSVIVFLLGVAWAIKSFFIDKQYPTREEVISFSMLLLVLNCIVTGTNILNILKIFKGMDSNNVKTITSGEKK